MKLFNFGIDAISHFLLFQIFIEIGFLQLNFRSNEIFSIRCFVMDEL